jgi:hypothetical protein
VHGASGCQVEPVSSNRLNAAQYSPAELEWVDALARHLSDGGGYVGPIDVVEYSPA